MVSPHKLVEKRNGEGHVAVSRTVDHSLFDEFGANGTKGCNFHAKSVRDVARPIPKCIKIYSKSSINGYNSAQRDLLRVRFPYLCWEL